MRGKAREYSPAFESAWRLYGRREEKLKAYGEWLIQARLAGGDTLLLPLIVAAFKWQVPMWNEVGWKYAPYFERYLKRRKWEDERPPMPAGIQRKATDDIARRTAEAQDKRRAEESLVQPLTPEQRAEVQASIKQLAHAKGMKDG